MWIRTCDCKLKVPPHITFSPFCSSLSTFHHSPLPLLLFIMILFLYIPILYLPLFFNHPLPNPAIYLQFVNIPIANLIRDGCLRTMRWCPSLYKKFTRLQWMMRRSMYYFPFYNNHNINITSHNIISHHCVIQQPGGKNGRLGFTLEVLLKYIGLYNHIWGPLLTQPLLSLSHAFNRDR